MVIPNILTNTILGNNAGWTTRSVTFTATQTSTPVIMTGVEPGFLLDGSSLSSQAGGNLYYQPEVSLDPLIDTFANGTGFHTNTLGRLAVGNPG